MFGTSHLDVVLIPSTHCNLRCTYCYELSHLDDTRVMSTAQLTRVFERLAEFCEQRALESARCVWHGGEPLLLPPDYYWQAFELQRRCFAGVATRVQHTTQTNLTVLDAERTELLRTGFDSVGVSLDLFGSLRVNRAGRAVEPKVIANVDRLLSDGVRLGGITVLTRGNRRRMAEVFAFYRQRNMRFRLLPLHAGDFAAGQWFEISPSDTLRAFCELAELWLADPHAPDIHPIVDTIQRVYAELRGATAVQAYAPLTAPRVIAVDREGFVSSYENIHDRARSYGNLLDAPLASLLESDSSRRLAAEFERRLEGTCRSCPHFARSCSGYPMAEGAHEYWDREADGAVRCTAFAGFIAYLKARLAAVAGGLAPEHSAV